MTTLIHTYDEAYILNVTVKPDGSCRIYNEYEYHIRDVINKMACLNPYSDYSLASELYNETDKQTVPPGAKLFFAKECKTQRDIFRNSGYSIKIKPGDADVIVVPDVFPWLYHTHECNLVAMTNDDKNLILVNIAKPGRSIGDDITVDDVELVKKYLIALRNYKFDDSAMTTLKVWFIPKCHELKEVMLNCKGFPMTPYIQESLIPINASTKFSPETLMYWKNIAMQDQEILAKTICTSNWKEYKFTLLAFLKMHGERNWNLVGNSDFKNILRVIGYEPYTSMKYNLNNMNVNPKDYDMFQSYVYYLLGLDPEKGGFVDKKAINSMDRIGADIINFFQTKYAFKPIHLSGPMTGEAVANLLH